MKRIFGILILLLSISCCVNGQSMIWRQIIGEQFDEFGYNAFELKDKGFLIVGNKQIQSSGSNFLILKSYVIKLDRYGNIVWEKLIGDSINANSAITAAEDLKGNIYIPYRAGSARLIKMNSIGNILWDKEYSSYEIEVFKGISFVNNYSRIVILGQTFRSEISATSSITKLDTNGNLIWNRIYYDSIPPVNSYTSHFNAFLFLDDQYYICGRNGESGFVLRTDTSGFVIWNTGYSQTTGIYSITQSSFNTFIASAYDNSGGLLRCLKIDGNSKLIWSRNYINDTLATGIGFEKLTNTLDGNFALGTTSGNNLGRLGIIDSSGNFITSKYYYYDSIFHIDQNNINSTSDSGFIIVGSIGISAAHDSFFTDLLVFKTNKYGKTVFVSNISDFIDETEISVFPNPFNSSFNLKMILNHDSFVTIELYDIAGKKISEIENKELRKGALKYKINTSELPSGIYFVRTLLNNKLLYSNKILLIK